MILMHLREWHRSSNTGVLARLALPQTTLCLHGGRQPAGYVTPIPEFAGCNLILFPTASATPLTAEFVRQIKQPIRLIVPDGTWGQARQMLKRIPALHGVPCVALDAPQLDIARPRKQCRPDRMSTFEAIAQAMRILESVQGNQTAEAMERGMLQLFQHAAERHLFMRGRLKPSEMMSPPRLHRDAQYNRFAD